MDTKKMLAYLLGATLMVQAGTMTYALEVGEVNEKTTLTLDTAIKQATAKSLKLKQEEQERSLIEETQDRTYVYEQSNLLTINDDATKEEKMIKDQVALKVTSLYETLILNQKELEILNSKLELLEKQNVKDQVEAEEGLKSYFYLQQQDLAYQQKLQTKSELTQKINLQYIELEDTVGLTLNQYTLEAITPTYTPYEVIPNVSDFVSEQAKKHIALWQTRKENKGLTKENLEAGILELYVNTKQLEQQYTYLQSDLALKQKQLAVNQTYLEKGMISKLQYEQSELAYSEAKLKIQQVINNHNKCKFQLEHPHLIQLGMSGI